MDKDHQILEGQGNGVVLQPSEAGNGKVVTSAPDVPAVAVPAPANSSISSKGPTPRTWAGKNRERLSVHGNLPCVRRAREWQRDLLHNCQLSPVLGRNVLVSFTGKMRIVSQEHLPRDTRRHSINAALPLLLRTVETKGVIGEAA